MHFWRRKTKLEKARWSERWRTSRKFKTHDQEWATRPFQFVVSVWFWWPRCFNIPYIFTEDEHDFISFWTLVNKFKGWKGQHFYGWPQPRFVAATSLRHSYNGYCGVLEMALHVNKVVTGIWYPRIKSKCGRHHKRNIKIIHPYKNSRLHLVSAEWSHQSDLCE